MTIKQVVLLSGMILASSGVQSAAETIGDHIRRIENGVVRMTYESRDGVCGDGHGSISFGDGYHEYRHYGRTIINDSDDRAWWYDCEEGPVRVALRVRDGEISRVRTVVGGEWRPDDDVTDLGAVDPEDAADFFLSLAVEGEGDIADDAVMAAVLARDAVVWPRLLEIARDKSAARNARSSSVFWLGQIAGEKATEGLAKLVDDDDVEMEVRKSAVFSLSQQESNQSMTQLIEIAKSNPHPQLRRSALFWLAQSDDPRVLRVFEDILTER